MERVMYLSIILLMLSLSYAADTTIYVETKDDSASFAQNMSAAQCAADNVQAVYICIGNVVRVVSSVPGEGNTFYKPDGKVVKCPVLPPGQIGGECMQLLMPNFCPTESVCGNATMPQVFPGQNGSAEQKANETYYIVPGQAATETENKTDVVVPEKPKPPKPNLTANVTRNEIDMTAPKPNSPDSVLDYLVYAVLLLGVGSLGVLFFMFKNSLSESE